MDKILELPYTLRAIAPYTSTTANIRAVIGFEGQTSRNESVPLSLPGSCDECGVSVIHQIIERCGVYLWPGRRRACTEPAEVGRAWEGYNKGWENVCNTIANFRTGHSLMVDNVHGILHNPPASTPQLCLSHQPSNRDDICGCSYQGNTRLTWGPGLPPRTLWRSVDSHQELLSYYADWWQRYPLVTALRYPDDRVSNGSTLGGDVIW